MAAATTQAEGQRLKYTLTHYRKSTRTHEAFMKWIVETHLPLALPVFKKHGILSYSLFVTPPPLNKGIKQQVQKIRPTWEFADFDCFIEYTLPNVEVIGKVMSDPDFEAWIKDQDEWLDSSRALVSLGYFTPYLLEGGEVLNMGN